MLMFSLLLKYSKGYAVLPLFLSLCSCLVWSTVKLLTTKHFNTVKHYFSPHRNFAIFLCRKFAAFLFRPVLLFTLYNTKNIAYHIAEELIFYVDKIVVMGNSKNLCVFNFIQIAKI